MDLMHSKDFREDADRIDAQEKHTSTDRPSPTSVGYGPSLPDRRAVHNGR